jgi:hypothetical protein
VVVFSSHADNLVENDTNGVLDVFAVDLAFELEADPYESNDMPDEATDLIDTWDYYHARCLDRFDVDGSGRGRWDLDNECLGIFEFYPTGGLATPRASVDVWTQGLTDLSLHSITDEDFFVTRLPETRDYEGSDDIRPEDDRAAGGTSEPMPECALIERDEKIALAGRLDVRVIPRGGNIDPRAETVNLYDDVAGMPVVDTGRSALYRSIYCPRSEEDLDQVLISFGERATMREEDSLGPYTLLLNYVIEARRSVPSWVIDLAESDGHRTVV